MNIKTDNFSRCLNPLTIRREVGGHYELTEDNERVYVGSRLVTQQVPCGRCLACQLDRADSWSMHSHQIQQLWQNSRQHAKEVPESQHH